MPLSLQISVLIPDCEALPANISSAFHSFSSYYLVRELPVYQLLEETFIESHVKKGRRRNMLLYIYIIFSIFLLLNQIFRFSVFTQETSMRFLTTPKLMKRIPLHFFPAVSKILPWINIIVWMAGCINSLD